MLDLYVLSGDGSVWKVNPDYVNTLVQDTIETYASMGDKIDPEDEKDLLDAIQDNYHDNIDSEEVYLNAILVSMSDELFRLVMEGTSDGYNIKIPGSYKDGYPVFSIGGNHD